MIGGLTVRMLRGIDPRLQRILFRRFILGGARALRRHRRESRRGKVFPAFLFLSVTTRCNLRCKGCWVDVEGPPKDMDPALLDHLLAAGKARGRSFFGILGGEPLLYPPLFDVLRRHPDCYFQLFTNGTLLTPEIVETMRRLGNITPLISLEGLEKESDARRGGSGVYDRAREGIRLCTRGKLMTGIATSVCATNYAETVNPAFIREAIDLGALYLWYYIYRVSGPRPSPELALTEDQILGLRQFLVEERARHPILMVDAYWDELGRAQCPAATGLSHHINPWGDVEPCPPIQFACDRLRADSDVGAVLESSALLRAFRTQAPAVTPGCILLEQPDRLLELLREQGARDTSGRGTAEAELAALPRCACHHLPGKEIPERQALYRMAKRSLFFGLGGYG